VVSVAKVPQSHGAEAPREPPEAALEELDGGSVGIVSPGHGTKASGKPRAAAHKEFSECLGLSSFCLT